MQKSNELKKIRPIQHQQRPGKQYKMQPIPVMENDALVSSGKLQNKIALITGGDSGIGSAVALLFAK